MSVTATYFDVVSYVEADRSSRFALQQTSYYTSDGYVFRRQLLWPIFESEAEAEAYALRMDTSFPESAAMREP